jgi:hypothetical protein
MEYSPTVVISDESSGDQLVVGKWRAYWEERGIAGVRSRGIVVVWGLQRPHKPALGDECLSTHMGKALSSRMSCNHRGWHESLRAKWCNRRGWSDTKNGRVESLRASKICRFTGWHWYKWNKKMWMTQLPAHTRHTYDLSLCYPIEYKKFK